MNISETKIQELLLDFYSNQENTKLANYYATPTLFDMIKKSRSETVHSAVIKWLLEGNDFPNQGSNSTLMHFLQTVLRRKTGVGFGNAAKQDDLCLMRVWRMPFIPILSRGARLVSCLTIAL